MKKIIAFVFAGLLLTGSFCTPRLAAQQLATLTITVADPSGRVVSNARITVRVNTNATRSNSSCLTGTAVLPGLPAGNYALIPIVTGTDAFWPTVNNGCVIGAELVGLDGQFIGLDLAGIRQQPQGRQPPPAGNNSESAFLALAHDKRLQQSACAPIAASSCNALFAPAVLRTLSGESKSLLSGIDEISVM